MKIKTILLVLVLSFLTAWADDSKPAIDIKDKEGQGLAYCIYMLQMEDFLMEAVKKIGTKDAVDEKEIFSLTEARVILNIKAKTKADIKTILKLIMHGNKEKWDYKIFRPLYEEHKALEAKGK